MKKSINLTGLKNEYGQEICFMHGYCHYLALGLAEEYSSKVGLWFDYDYNLDTGVLVHAFAVIGDCIYFDAEGFFTDLSEREADFEYNLEPDIVVVSKEEAKKILRKMKIPYGETSIKRFVRYKLRDHALVIDTILPTESYPRRLFYKGEGHLMGRDGLIVSTVSPNGEVSNHHTRLSLEEFMKARKVQCRVMRKK